MGNRVHIDLSKMAVRAQVCTKCAQRPPGSELLSSIEPRTCEKSCEIFINLPRLTEFVSRTHGEPPCGYLAAIRSLACDSTPACATSCDTRNNACDPKRPIVRYVDELFSALERVAALESIT